MNREYGMRLATADPADDGPIWMVNLMSYRERAEYADGGGPDVSGREADDLYAPIDVLADVGAEVVFVADVDTQLLGHEPTWHRIGIVKYPTRRAFIEMQTRPDFAERHVHKEAGMASTIVMGCVPIDPPVTDDLEWADWSEVPHPPTADDGPVAVLHVIQYADDNDGRSWHEVRIDMFPSRAAFMAVAMDPARLAAQTEHREPAMADTYTMILRPTINRLPGA